MSNLNFENIVGFKAVDKDGNEQNVTVDEMVDMVSTRMVMALSETSTFAAAAATGNDVYENELPTVTDAANVRVLQSSGDAAKMTMQSLASKLEELIGFPYRGYKLATNENLDGFIERGVCVLGQPDASGVGPNDHGMLICGVTPSGGIFQVMFSIRNKIYHRYRSTSGVWNPWYVYTSSVYNP